MTHPVRALARRRGDGRERGAAAVEFALILAVLMPILFGIINFGFALSERQAVSQAAAEGARAAAVLPGTPDQKKARGLEVMQETLATQELVCAEGCGSKVVITADCDGAHNPAGTIACVTASVQYEPLIPGFWFGDGVMTYTAAARVS